MLPRRRGTQLSLIMILTALLTLSLGLRGDRHAAPDVVAPDVPYASAVCRGDLAELMALYPDLISLRSLGQSVYGKELSLAAMGAGPKKILIVGGTHGREWMTSMLIVKMMAVYASAWQAQASCEGYDLKRLMSEVTFLFLPMLNPDGVDISLYGLEAAPDDGFILAANLGRSDFSSWKANGEGVDLNLQFPANWPKAASASKPRFERYKGPAPESAPESRLLAQLVREEEPAAVLTYHASGRVIFWYYDQSGAAYRRDQAMAAQLSKATGYRAVIENEYDRHGGLKDWVIHDLHKPAFTIEIGRLTEGRALPLADFPDIWRENGTTPLRLAELIAE